jgi:hypothetical protein
MTEANTIEQKSGLAPVPSDFVAFVTNHFDAGYYLDAYPDVAQAGADPLQHWLNYGVGEGRQISRSVVLRYGRIARRSTDRIWTHYRWQNHDIAARIITPAPPEVISSIIKQARHDPAVLPFGEDVVAQLAQLAPAHRENVHIDVVGLQRAVRCGAEVVVVVPALNVNRTATDLVAALSTDLRRPVQTVVADQQPSEDGDSSPIPEPFGATNILFWQDLWVEGPETFKLWQLAQLLRLMRPRATIVSDSRHGYEMIARFGRAVSECTRLYCVYSQEPPSRDYAARYPRRTLPFATALTDDADLAATLNEHCGDLPGHGVVLLPRHPPAAFADAVAGLLPQI